MSEPATQAKIVDIESFAPLQQIEAIVNHAIAAAEQTNRHPSGRQLGLYVVTYHPEVVEAMREVLHIPAPLRPSDRVLVENLIRAAIDDAYFDQVRSRCWRGSGNPSRRGLRLKVVKRLRSQISKLWAGSVID